MTEVVDAIDVALTELRLEREKLKQELSQCENAIIGLENVRTKRSAEAFLEGEVRALKAPDALVPFLAKSFEEGKQPLASLGIFSTQQILRNSPNKHALVKDIFEAFPEILKERYNPDRAGAVEALRAQIKKYSDEYKSAELRYDKGVVYYTPRPKPQPEPDAPNKETGAAV